MPASQPLEALTEVSSLKVFMLKYIAAATIVKICVAIILNILQSSTSDPNKEIVAMASYPTN